MSNSRLNQTENDRRISGIIGMGKIVDVRLSDYTARVQDGDLITGWLRMGAMRAFGDAQSWPYAKGEEVCYATISGDLQDGAILCALANGQSPADAVAGVFRARSGGGFDFTGDITVAGDINVTGNIAVTGNINVTGDITATGDITTPSDVKAGGISLQNHTHPGDSGGVTGKPL